MLDKYNIGGAGVLVLRQQRGNTMNFAGRNIVRTVIAIVGIGFTGTAATAAAKFAVFETIHHSSVSFEETTTAVEAGLRSSGLELHAVHDIRVPEGVQEARIYVLTSPDYMAAASSESPRTVSAQVLRVAVYTFGEDLQTFVDMSSPRAHAMVFYTDSDSYDDLLDAADRAAQEIRDAVSSVPGEAVSVPHGPMRTERHYRRYKGDGPARMMAKFRTFRKSQLEIGSAEASAFDETVSRVAAKLASSTVADASESEGWEIVTQISIGEDSVYFGLTNPYIEDNMIRINSRFRSDGKSDTAAFPGVDHVTALPTEVLIIREGDETLVLHYGQMWRMQLYFWDSGYRAFTLNVGVPSSISNSIEDVVEDF